MSIKIMKWAISAHQKVNHQYDDMPYSIHLFLTVQWANRFINLVQDKYQEAVIDACWLHDVIENARIAYNDVLHITNDNIFIANIVYAVTNEKGRNRKERANTIYYEGITSTPYATFVKLCDRLANIEYSLEFNSKMFNVYKSEHNDFITNLNLMPNSLFYPMIEPMNQMLNIK